MQSSLEGDRATYQQDPANATESLRELELDIAEGADIVMVKPAMPHLDIVAAAAELSPVPVAAYQISGEYSMIEAASAQGCPRPSRPRRSSPPSRTRAEQRRRRRSIPPPSTCSS